MSELDEARALLGKYEQLGVDARLQNGPVMLAEVQARAAIALAEHAQATAAALTRIAEALRPE